ncbi:MAG: hypothetical protein ACJA2M_001537 [Polaribacter sp.]|jgi:hypothetical protein
MANANNKKEIATSNFKEVKIEKVVKSNSINLFDYSLELSQNNLAVFGCGSECNDYHMGMMMDGFTHREARKKRREYVRACRGLPEGGWLPIALEVVKVVAAILK